MSFAAARAALVDDLGRVGGGDRDALKRVYDATAAKLMGICLRFAGDRASAEDALQETFVKVWRHADRFDPARASPITWLCLLARGTAIDAARASGRRNAALSALAEEPTGAAAGDAADGVALDQCLGTLPDEQRSAIRAAFLDGYAYSELAERLAVPLGTMKSRIRRGLAALKRCLDGD